VGARQSCFFENRDLKLIFSVRRLLKRLQFLFELPKRLRESIELNAHGEAVHAFKVTLCHRS
jgi:hypothetical protein